MASTIARSGMTSKQKWIVKSLLGLETKDIPVEEIDSKECYSLINRLVNGTEEDKAQVKALFLAAGAVACGNGSAADESALQYSYADRMATEAADNVEYKDCDYAAMAFVRIDPGTCKFARYMKEHCGGVKGANLTGGIRVAILKYGDDYHKNETYAAVFAQTMRHTYGIMVNAYYELMQ